MTDIEQLLEESRQRELDYLRGALELAPAESYERLMKIGAMTGLVNAWRKELVARDAHSLIAIVDEILAR